MNIDPEHVVELAKAANNQQNPRLAIQHLISVERVLDTMPETSIWAEHRLVLAEAYGGLGDEAAPSFFEEAIERLDRLAERRPALVLRAREHYADYLIRFPRRLSMARELLVAAGNCGPYRGRRRSAHSNENSRGRLGH